jgi:hypothetical protein
MGLDQLLRGALRHGLFNVGVLVRRLKTLVVVLAVMVVLGVNLILSVLQVELLLHLA